MINVVLLGLLVAVAFGLMIAGCVQIELQDRRERAIEEAARRGRRFGDDEPRYIGY